VRLPGETAKRSRHKISLDAPTSTSQSSINGLQLFRSGHRGRYNKTFISFDYIPSLSNHAAKTSIAAALTPEIRNERTPRLISWCVCLSTLGSPTSRNYKGYLSPLSISVSKGARSWLRLAKHSHRPAPRCSNGSYCHQRNRKGSCRIVHQSFLDLPVLQNHQLRLPSHAEIVVHRGWIVVMRDYRSRKSSS
jgi:hypothetical protein